MLCFSVDLFFYFRLKTDKKNNCCCSDMFFGHSSDTLSTRAYAAVMTRRYAMHYNSLKRRSENPEMSLIESSLRNPGPPMTQESPRN